MTKPRDRNFLEAFLENAEAMTDLVTDNEAVRSIPVIGTAFKIAKGIDDVRSRALIAKLTKFISEPALQSNRVKLRMQERLAHKPDEQNKIGETLFLVLDQMTDLDKPALLAKVFVAYLDNVISDATLRRLGHALDTAFLDDVNELLNMPDDLPNSTGNEWKQALVGAGLARPVSGQTYEDQTKMYYEPTTLARELRHAIAHAQQCTAG